MTLGGTKETEVKPQKLEAKFRNDTEQRFVACDDLIRMAPWAHILELRGSSRWTV